MKPITPCLWFNNTAEEAVNLYLSVFNNARIKDVTRFTEAGQEIHQQKPGTVMTIDFELNGQPFTALNGGPLFKFTEAISLQVFCETQEELDRYWGQLTAGGDPEAQQCGWLKDKFGISWQLLPAILPELMKGDGARAARVMTALLQMKKLDIATLKQAAEAD